MREDKTREFRESWQRRYMGSCASGARQKATVAIVCGYCSWTAGGYATGHAADTPGTLQRWPSR